MYVHFHNFITPNITFLILATFQCLHFYLYGTGPLTMTVSGGSGVWPTTYFSKSAEEGVVIQEAVTLDIAPQDSAVVSFFLKISVTFSLLWFCFLFATLCSILSTFVLFLKQRNIIKMPSISTNVVRQICNRIPC